MVEVREGEGARAREPERARLVRIFRFASLLFVALALAPAAAHLLELPNKIDLPAADYLTVQQIYRGWELLGIVVLGALLSTLVLVVLVRRERKIFAYTLTAWLLLAASNVLFWVFTFPANQATENWTVLTADWMALRRQWEYSHAAAAVLVLCALIALIASVLVDRGDAAGRGA
ncbi:MAG: DUF1772 domain-containing protein [Gemmatimonadota bacterium]